MGYISKLSQTITFGVEYLRNKSFFKTPEKLSLADLEQAISQQEFNGMPDPLKDYVWVRLPPKPKINKLLPRANIFQKINKAAEKLTPNRGKEKDRESIISGDSVQRKHNFLQESPGIELLRRKMETGANRIKDLLDLLRLDDKPEIHNFAWMKTGVGDRNNHDCYRAFSADMNAIRERRNLKVVIKQKLKYLLMEDSPLICDNENYANFYYMVQNEIKMNGPDKISRVFNQLLDTNLKLMRASKGVASINTADNPVFNISEGFGGLANATFGGTSANQLGGPTVATYSTKLRAESAAKPSLPRKLSNSEVTGERQNNANLDISRLIASPQNAPNLSPRPKLPFLAKKRMGISGIPD
jgi:hypothetical protein